MASTVPEDLEDQLAQRRRREKRQISCNPCRQRKVRCDRSNPCGKCIHRNDVAGCIFPVLLAGNQQRRRQQPHQSDLQDRIARLESIVPSLVHQSPHGLTEPPTPVSDTRQSAAGFFGSIQMKENETSYVGGEHWAVIADNLADSQELNPRQRLSGHQDASPPELLLGLRREVSLQTLLASIPPKAEVDRLISNFFDSMDVVVLVTHAPTFQDEYDRFWLDPSSVSIKWLSMLFSMMYLATDFFIRSSEKRTDGQNVTTDFCQQGAQCLILADYTKPTAYTVEALVLYFHCELSRTQNVQFALHLILVTIVRIALKMGYHRDAEHYPSISVFHGELRRRLWAHLVQLDVLISFQVGLPRIINEVETDTLSPRNLRDEDMYETMTILPPSRSEDDSTKLSYIITRIKLLAVVGKIQSQVTSIHPLSYDTVIQLHKLLDAQYDAVPPSLKVQKRSFATDSKGMILRRVALDLLYQKTRCVLHRRFLKPQHQLSWDTCIEAALNIIHHQSFVYQECQPGGVVRGQKWKVTCLSTYDFLLAAMIICLALNSQIDPKKDSSSSVDPSTAANRWQPEILLSALEKTYMIWTEWSMEIKEARPVVKIVKTLLSRIRKDYPMSISNSQDSSDSTHFSLPPSTSYTNDVAATSLAPDFSVATSNSIPKSTSVDTMEAFCSSLEFLEPSTASVEGIDWATWDSQLQENGVYYYSQI